MSEMNGGLGVASIINFGWRMAWSLSWVLGGSEDTIKKKGGSEDWSLGDKSFDRPKSPFLGTLGGK